jgi:molybdopterin synthase sulfur carrier subunit
MAKVVFTSHLQRHVASPECNASGATVGAVLREVFAANPALRGYLLDDQEHVRKHVAVFVDGRKLRDREHLSDRVTETSEIYVLQALTGG